MILKNGKRLDGCSDTVPIGTLNPYIGSVAPYGYLICEGQLVSKTTYKELYEICGDTFGTGTETEFRLPDLRGKTIAGYKEGDTLFGVLGKLIGNENHNHDISHTHGVPGVAHAHTTGNHTLTVSEIPSHMHDGITWGLNGRPFVYTGVGGNDATFDLAGPGVYSQNINYAGTNHIYTSYTGGSGAHNHGNTGSTTPNATTTNSQSTTTSGSSSNIQPTIVMNWIVKAFLLMPNQSYVENSLTSSSEINALSAAKGKELNDRINALNIPTVNNTLTSTSTTQALSAAQGKVLNDDLTSLKNKSNLVRHIEINSTVDEVNINNLDIVRDGGIYDILIYCYSGGTQRDWYMTINNQSTTNYTSIRTFARHGGGSSGECSPINPYVNINENKFVMGDAYNRWMYTGVLTLFSEIASTGGEARVPRIQGKTTIAEPTAQSLIDMGGYYNPNSGVDNITSLQFKIAGFAAGHIFIFKREF